MVEHSINLLAFQLILMVLFTSPQDRVTCIVSPNAILFGFAVMVTSTPFALSTSAFGSADLLNVTSSGRSLSSVTVPSLRLAPLTLMVVEYSCPTSMKSSAMSTADGLTAICGKEAAAPASKRDSQSVVTFISSINTLVCCAEPSARSTVLILLISSLPVVARAIVGSSGCTGVGLMYRFTMSLSVPPGWNLYSTTTK